MLSASEVRVFPMRISIETLIEAPGKTLPFAFSVDAAALGLDKEDLQFDDQLQVRLEAVYRDGKIDVTGSLRMKVAFLCSRCLKSFSCPIVADFEDEIPVDHTTDVDLTELARELFFTALPLKPLCDEDCKGLCHSCGGDLNKKQCGCPNDEIDHRLSVLKKLLDE